MRGIIRFFQNRLFHSNQNFLYEKNEGVVKEDNGGVLEAAEWRDLWRAIWEKKIDQNKDVEWLDD